ncbi:zinc finger BED domain-containing protein 4-like [Erpetoichthys calabaricus]|uniref:zinc finger BED domain-containing protein 4-like n=1 Tax=Erpetoichthys calabaricus TaxID=27687 RepID=UPI0010A087A6|nr:zinc finger BED domain-containing protein 4-like [Erpetoichthys calabaricus]
MPCMAHTLQLALKDAMKQSGASSAVNKARNLIHSVRKSSVANEQMIKRCGRTLIRDCPTRWNSTLDMLKRLLETKATLNEVLDELGIDTLLTSDWAKLENQLKVLEPFGMHTDQLQTDSQSLSEVIPSLLNLEAHLQSTSGEKNLAQALLKCLRQRFTCLLDPISDQFDPVPAAACLMDPTVSLTLQSPELISLKRTAELFVLTEAAKHNHTIEAQQDESTQTVAVSANITVLQKYKYLANKINSLNPENQPWPSESALLEMQKYQEEVRQGDFTGNPLQFWQARVAVYPKLSPVALDLVCAPASQAFVERIFSVCGQLSSGLRNRMTTSLEHRVFLKINRKMYN